MNSNYFNRIAAVVSLLLLTLLLLGCGGETTDVDFASDLDSPVADGINNEDLVDAPNGQLPSSDGLLPQIDLGPRQFADSNVLLSIAAQVTAAGSATITNTLWTQVSGPNVDIPSRISNTLAIVTPNVSVTRIIELRFTAQDDEGRINSATLPVVVRPLDSPISVIGGVYNEFSGTAEFEIRLAETSINDFNINYITIAGSALAGEDFELVRGNVVIPAGELSTTVEVPLIDDDVLEQDESFSLQAVASDGVTSFANTGPAIIRNGLEPVLAQVMAFGNAGPVALSVGDVFLNTFAPGSAPLGVGELLYASSDPLVASVDPSGTVIAINPGNATITATKAADQVYRSGEAGYDVRVTLANDAPVVNFVNLNGGAISSASISNQRGPDINVQMTDTEDGMLPTVAQLAELSATGVPIASYNWVSDLDGSLGNGHFFPDVTLSSGHHIVSFSARDSGNLETTESIDLFVSNIGPIASSVLATSELCEDPRDPTTCFSRFNAINTLIDTGNSNTEAWAADVSLTEQVLTIGWTDQAIIRGIEIYTTQGSEIRDFVIEGTDFFTGSAVTLATVNGNTDTVMRFPLLNPNVSEIRIRAISGPDSEPNIVRINEVVIFGTLIPLGPM